MPTSKLITPSKKMASMSKVRFISFGIFAINFSSFVLAV